MSVYTNDNVSHDRGMMMVLWMMIRDIQSRFVFATRSANGQTIRNDIPLASVPSTAQQNTHKTTRRQGPRGRRMVRHGQPSNRFIGAWKVVNAPKNVINDSGIGGHVLGIDIYYLLLAIFGAQRHDPCICGDGHQNVYRSVFCCDLRGWNVYGLYSTTYPI